MAESDFSSKTTNTGYERSDLSPNKIALFGVSLAAVIGLVLFVAYLLMHRFYTEEAKKEVIPSPLSYTPELVPGPRLIVDPGREFREMRAAEDRILKSYDWIEKEKGIARIPIDRAMDILAQKGLPTRKEPLANVTSGQHMASKTKTQKDTKGE